jgi:hypothetical protein
MAFLFGLPSRFAKRRPPAQALRSTIPPRSVGCRRVAFSDMPATLVKTPPPQQLATAKIDHTVANDQTAIHEAFSPPAKMLAAKLKGLRMIRSQISDQEFCSYVLIAPATASIAAAIENSIPEFTIAMHRGLLMTCNPFDCRSGRLAL